MKIGNDIEGESEYLTGGSGVAINATGEMVAVGFAENNDPGTPAGRGIVRIYELVGNTWQQIGNDLLDDAEGDDFGSEISMNDLGNRIALGARLYSEVEPFSGYVRVFELQNNNWEQLGNTLEGELAEALGTSVDLNADGTILVAGGRANNPINVQSGIVRVFRYINNDWEQHDDPIYGVADDDRSGRSVGINSLGDKVVMGAPFNDENGSNAGHARCFYNEDILTIPRNDLNTDTTLYPNPNNGFFTLNFSVKFQNTHVSIVDITGKILSSETFLNSENTAFNQNLSPGIYFVKVNSEYSKETLKMIVD